MEILEQLDPLLKTFWTVASVSSLVFLIQTVMTFSGTDAFDGVQADFSGHLDGSDAPFQLFSFRNLINFLLGFSWTGVSLYSTIPNQPLLIGLSVVIGVLFVYGFFVIIQRIQVLEEDNSFKMTNTLNKTAEVYLTIPEHKSGKGKVIISANGSFRELDAMTESHRILTGSVVKVIRIENDSILIVESI